MVKGILIDNNLDSKILIEPARSKSVDELRIVSGYASATMASWHIKKLRDLNLSHIRIRLVIGMSVSEGISVSTHNDFKSLMVNSDGMFQCQYLCQGSPIHSKVYTWLSGDEPVLAFTGSADYFQSAFLRKRKEIMVECDPSHVSTPAKKYAKRRLEITPLFRRFSDDSSPMFFL